MRMKSSAIVWCYSGIVVFRCYGLSNSSVSMNSMRSSVMGLGGCNESICRVSV